MPGGVVTEAASTQPVRPDAGPFGTVIESGGQCPTDHGTIPTRGHACHIAPHTLALLAPTACVVAVGER